MQQLNLEALIGYEPKRLETMTQAELAPIAACLDKLDAILRPIMEEADQIYESFSGQGYKHSHVEALDRLSNQIYDILGDLGVVSALARRDELLTEAYDRQAAEDQRRDYRAGLGVKTGPTVRRVSWQQRAAEMDEDMQNEIDGNMGG